MFLDRFHLNPASVSRADLSFRATVARTPDIKGEWGFIWDDAHKSNIAATLQSLHFDILLCNTYNVYYSPLQMKYKAALVQLASVAELVLQYMLLMVEDDPRVEDVLGTRWTWIDFNAVPQPGIDVPEGLRTIAGTQREVQNAFDRNTKMKRLIQAAQAVEIVDAPMAERLDELRDLRNRIHIKSLDAPEYNVYTPALVNGAIETIEAFRVAALRWTFAKRTELAQRSIAETLQQRAETVVEGFTIGEVVQHDSLGIGTVVELRGDGQVVIQLQVPDQSFWSVSPASLLRAYYVENVHDDELEF
jgi:hypothetical protein